IILGYLNVRNAAIAQLPPNLPDGKKLTTVSQCCKSAQKSDNQKNEKNFSHGMFSPSFVSGDDGTVFDAGLPALMSG
ncbi:hypothetical protein OFB92_36975, partial [Escherichia coli]|nr:hypothetical protein [Escherichia coli]